LSTWIYTITRNAALTERQSAAARRTLPLDDAPAGSLAHGGPAQSNAPTRSGFDVAALVSQLRPQYQQVIRLYYLEENSYEEVSRMLDIPLGTVKTLLHRARIELVARLAPATVKEG
jgi:RNA polymerase sigma-70 factor (ECF subfamily)